LYKGEFTIVVEITAFLRIGMHFFSNNPYILKNGCPPILLYILFLINFLIVSIVEPIITFLA
jgi:pilus assembly protein TadC